MQIKIPDKLDDLKQAFDAVQMPRSAYMLNKLIVDTKYTEEGRYQQCVNELCQLYDTMRIANAKVKLKQLEVNEIDDSTERGRLQKEIKLIELEQTRRAFIGAMREFEVLYQRWQEFPTKYTAEQIEASKPEEYRLMIEAQATHDLNAYGKIMPGNQEALRQINRQFIQVTSPEELEKLNGNN